MRHTFEKREQSGVSVKHIRERQTKGVEMVGSRLGHTWQPRCGRQSWPTCSASET